MDLQQYTKPKTKNLNSSCLNKFKESMEFTRNKTDNKHRAHGYYYQLSASTIENTTKRGHELKNGNVIEQLIDNDPETPKTLILKEL